MNDATQLDVKTAMGPKMKLEDTQPLELRYIHNSETFKFVSVPHVINNKKENLLLIYPWLKESDTDCRCLAASENTPFSSQHIMRDCMKPFRR